MRAAKIAMPVPVRPAAPPPPTESSEPRNWFRRKPAYDRRQILATASTLQGKGKAKKAIAEYQKVLAVEPENATLWMKVAVLFAETRQPDDAWKGFNVAAELFRKEGLVDKCSSVWAQAVLYFPKSIDAWMSLAEARGARGVKADAAAALLQGSRKFRKRKERAARLRLLRHAFEQTPLAYEVTMEYSAALTAGGLRADARELLEDLAKISSGRKLRRIRGRLFRLAPTPAAAWRWTRAALRGR